MSPTPEQLGKAIEALIAVFRCHLPDLNDSARAALDNAARALSSPAPASPSDRAPAGSTPSGVVQNELQTPHAGAPVVTNALHHSDEVRYFGNDVTPDMPEALKRDPRIPSAPEKWWLTKEAL